MKYILGQMVSVPRYNVQYGEITGIHIYDREKGDSVNSIDYDISFYSDGCWFRESYSEEHLEE